MFLSPSLYGIFRSGLSGSQMISLEGLRVSVAIPVWHLQEWSFSMASSGVVFQYGIFRSVLSGSQIRLEGLRVSVAISEWHLQEWSF